MKWINLFTKNSIKYCIYKLNKEDWIWIKNVYTNNSLIILYGSIYITKTFTNQEIIPLAILNKDNIFTPQETNINYKFYYKLIALETTYLISFNITSLKNIRNENYFISNIIKSYKITLSKYESMNEILNQKNAKNRITQLILFLCLEFGTINKKQIYIPFKLSQKSLANMSNTNKNTVNKIIKCICDNIYVKYLKRKKIYIHNIFNIN